MAHESSIYRLEHGFGLENLKLQHRPMPTPGPHEVLLKMHAWSLNYRDLLMIKGLYNPKLRLPMTPLSDGAGEIIAIGSKVTRVQVGDRVAGIFMQKWLGGELNDDIGRSALGGSIDGLLAQHTILHEDGVVNVPTHLSFAEAATLPCAGVTAWNALVEQGKLRAGDTVLTQGTGGVSIFALQFARMHGAQVIATTSQTSKAQKLTQMGASAVVNYRDTPKWGEKVCELAGKGGVQHVVEVGGAGNMAQSLRAVRMGGQISLIGVLAGGEFNPMAVLMKHVKVQGIYVGSREMFEHMNQAISHNQMRPVIDRVFSYTQVQEAFAHLESGAHFGKVVLAIN